MAVNKSIKDIKDTPKTRAMMRDRHKIITFYGSTGNGKSVRLSIKGLSRIFKAPSWQKTFVLAGKDIITLEKRFVESNHSVFNWFPFAGRWEYKKQNVSGGAQIVCHTATGDKQIFLTPFNNVNTYSRVLGSTIDGFMIDEAVESDELFLQECVSRTIRQDHTWLIQTSNGGDPSHYFYSGIVDKSYTIDDFEWEEFITSNQEKEYGNPLGKPVEKSVPEEELRYQEKDRDSYKMFYHMSLEDNPTYTKEQLDAYYREYPVGSYMWFSRILGVRGFSEESPFSSYLAQDVFVNLEKSRENARNIIFSVDAGGHVFSKKYMPESPYNEGDYGTNKGGHTVMISVLFDARYKSGVILGVHFPNRMIQVESAELISQNVYQWAATYPTAQRPYMFSDPADSSMLATLRGRVKNVKEIRPAIKNNKSIGLSDPVVISLIQQYFATGKLKILDTAENRRWLVPALMSARQEKDGKLLDNESWESDIVDALKYVFSTLYRVMIANRM